MDGEVCDVGDGVGAEDTGAVGCVDTACHAFGAETGLACSVTRTQGESSVGEEGGATDENKVQEQTKLCRNTENIP